MSKILDKENSLVEQLKNGLEQAKGFLLEELIKIGTASKDKIIDVNDDNVNQAIQSLIYADPDDPKNKNTGSGALSIVATIKDNEKKIKNWIEEGYAPGAFDEIRKEMHELPNKLKKELLTQQGIDALINERVKNNTILQHIPFLVHENNSVRGTTSIEKNNIISKIKEHIKISQTVVSSLLQDKALLKPLIEQITKNANEFFSKDETTVKNACILDETKLTQENINKFTEATNNNIKAFELIQQGLQNLDSEFNITQNQRITQALLPVISNQTSKNLEQNGTQIIKNIAPILKESNKLAEITKSALFKLDIGYIAKHNATIIKELQEVNNKGISVWEKLKSIFMKKDYLKEKLEKVINLRILKNDQYIKDKITTFSKTLTNNQFTEGLTNFIIKNKSNHPELQNINLSEIQSNKSALVNLRKINPNSFDQIVFEDTKQFNSNSKSQNVKIELSTITSNTTSKNRIRIIG